MNGPLSAYSDQTGSLPAPFSVNQGSFSVAGSDPTAVMPAYGYDSDNFWMDVQVTDTAPAGASYRLWPNYPTAPNTVSIDTGQQTSGTEFLLSQPCTLNNIWFYSPPGVSVLPSRCAIWNVATQAVVAGTDNTSPSWSGAPGSGWVSCAYSGVTLPPGTIRRRSIMAAARRSTPRTMTTSARAAGEGNHRRPADLPKCVESDPAWQFHLSGRALRLPEHLR